MRKTCLTSQVLGYSMLPRLIAGSASLEYGEQVSTLGLGPSRTDETVLEALRNACPPSATPHPHSQTRLPHEATAQARRYRIRDGRSSGVPVRGASGRDVLLPGGCRHPSPVSGQGCRGAVALAGRLAIVLSAAAGRDGRVGDTGPYLSVPPGARRGKDNRLHNESATLRPDPGGSRRGRLHLCQICGTITLCPSNCTGPRRPSLS